MKDVILGWDLKTGAALPERHKPLDIPLALILDPTVVVTGLAPTSGTVEVDVWGLDRRIVIVAEHFFTRSPWWTYGTYGAGVDGYDTEGYGYTVSVMGIMLAKDAQGEIHEIGALPSALWLNNGSAPDGAEIISGAEGIRFRYTISATNAIGRLNTTPSWDLKLHLSAVPNERIGCGEIVAAIGDSLRATYGQALAMFLPIGE